jgi:two-component system cell cycle response regulator DivK
MARILVVEDNPMNLKLVRDVLEYRGHTIDPAVDAREAMKRLREATPAVILLDIEIPGGGGEQLLKTIRSHAEWADLPIVAVTARAMEGDRERFMAAGFDGYISKPLDTRAFGPTVESFCKNPG